MLCRLTKTVRVYAAITLAIAYVICVVSPTLALAFGHAATLPCLTGDHHGVALVHSESNAQSHHGASAHHGSGHQDRNIHKHEQPAQPGSGGKQKDGACCVFLCLTAVATDVGVAIGHP